jgi:cation transport protein ChaC
MRARSEDLWVFAYGSLMWRPGFAFKEWRHGCLTGFHRGLCIYSMHYRGSKDRPGLVFGLDRGGTCEGILYRVEQASAAPVRSYLRDREQVSGVYREAFLPVALSGEPAREVLALAYVVERAHPSYAGRLPLAKQAHLVRHAHGVAGSNVDYLVSTLSHLSALHIRERELERLLALIGPHTSRVVACQGGLRARLAAKPLPRSSCRLRRPIALQGRSLPQRRRFLYRMRLSEAPYAAPPGGSGADGR